jgi:hypothetical protein
VGDKLLVHGWEETSGESGDVELAVDVEVELNPVARLHDGTLTNTVC